MVDRKKQSNYSYQSSVPSLLRLVKLNYAFAILKLLFFFIATVVLVPIYLIAKYVKVFKPYTCEFKIRSFWSKLGLWLCNVRVEVNGIIVHQSDVYVCNHVSWLDILTVQSLLNISFVAKSEVKRWPFFGFLAKIADTVFIDRRTMAAKSQQADLTQALKFGKRLCLFPEGTSTDGSHVLPFKSSLFEVFMSFEKEDNSTIVVHPISLLYLHDETQSSTIFGWWGDMSLVKHIFDIVANMKSGKVSVTFEEPIQVNKINDRKKLALIAESAIRKRFSN